MKNQKSNIYFLPHLVGFFSSFLGPLIFFLTSKEEKLRENSARAFNWQSSFLIYYLLTALISIIFPKSNYRFMNYMVFCFLFILAALNVIFCIVATLKASEGDSWDYPLAIPFIRLG